MIVCLNVPSVQVRSYRLYRCAAADQERSGVSMVSTVEMWRPVANDCSH